MAQALLLTLLSAALNAAWNVLLKTADDPLRTATRAVTLAMAAITPAIAVAWLAAGRPSVGPQAWGIAAASGLVELAYFLCLSTAYQRGDLSAVYPLARGSAPLLAVLAGLLILREQLRPITLAGIALLLLGIWAVRRPRAGDAALVPALLTGVCIATYTTLDGVGTHLAPPWLYAWVLWAWTAGWLLLWSLLRPRADAIQQAEQAAEQSAKPAPATGQAMVIGLLMTCSYWLVLLALRLAPLAVVAPLRESSIVLVAGWGVWRLHERRDLWPRAGGALAIVLGAVALAW
ncbi:MAG TPA: EamA family transporter [Chloroflexota bacterium]|jgi:drug/metabolite transporter (DMT)-like permease|nr:EamA family transporter [Chloroflexota bacterium]